MFPVPLMSKVEGVSFSFEVTAFDFNNSMDSDGMTVAVTVAIALACAHTFCGPAKEIIMNALTMVNIVLILDVSARTMPVNYFIFSM
jgi:hypothetical protein